MAAKYMPPGSIILGIDLLPIKAIRNVKTIVADITTAECRRTVTQELQGWKADVVLCDGAPNIGAAYAKDAYVQNELVLAALKTATDHLTPGGTFCTKVYRSVDYNSLIWVLQQLFENVQAMKPNSSRSQSSEIFVVCLNYNAPKFIDPKLLDPGHVFKEVADPGLKKVDVLHKKFDKLNRRHRTGYDESLGMLLTATATVTEFVESQEPVRLLSDVNQIIFSDACTKYKEHPLTSEEICRNFEDLKLLGKIDFKKLLKWRTSIRKAFEPEPEPAPSIAKGSAADRGPKTEDEIQEEILKMRENMLKQVKREKKKTRELAAKERTRQALGMTVNAFSGEEDNELFNLSEAEAADATGDIEAIELPDDIFETQEQDAEAPLKDSLLITENNLEDELESAYLRYVNTKKSKREREMTVKDIEDEELRMEGTPGGRTVTAKTARKAAQSQSKIAFREEEDNKVNHLFAGKVENQEDIDAYVKMLSVEDEESDGFSDEGSSNGESGDEELRKKKARTLVHHEEVPASSRAGKWFSHPIFKESVVDMVFPTPAPSNSGDSRSDDGVEISTAALETLREMPRTDKELRKEKRKKENLRQSKKRNKSDTNGGFDVAPNDEFIDEDIDERTRNHRSLISQGMGRKNVDITNNEIEIVPAQENVLPVHDTRSYDSDNEDYDNHDRATTLALGTLMLRPSKRKALVDASYNRYSWNDPKGLPSWFLDDEMRHNKPQLPIPVALLDQIKSKFQNVGTKDIKKVAEARMRKRKRAASKLKAAKKQANAVADNNDMSDKQKIRVWLPFLLEKDAVI